MYEYEGSSDRLRRIYARETSATYASFAYDDAGNLVRKSVAGQPDLLLEWDARDTLIRASRDAGGGASVVGEYGYDADGQRIFEDSLDRGSVHAYWAGAEPVLERSGSGDTRYHYSPGQGLVSIERDGSVEDALLDARGTTVQLGATRYATDPWGRIRGPTDEATGEVELPGVNRQVFTGHQHDLSTGLVYAKARYYDPDIGAFLSRDPLQGYDPQIPYSYNAYAYAYGNPMLYLDPTGMVSVRQGLADSCEQGGAAACAGAFTAFFGYTVLDAATFGALSREDQAIEDEEAGRISIEQRNEIFQRSIAQAAVAGAVNVATAGLGGAAAGSTAKGLVALGARQSIANVGAGAVVGGGVGVLARGAKDIGAGELSSVGEYATEGAYGALFGAGLATIGEIGGAIARRRVTAESSSGKRTYVTKATEGPTDPGLATRGVRPQAGTRNLTREQYRAFEREARVARRAAERALQPGDAAAPGASIADDFIGPRIGARTQARTLDEFTSEFYGRYQRYADEAYETVTSQIASGRRPLSGTIAAETEIGSRVDAISRGRLRAWLRSEGISEGPGGFAQVNRWLRDPSGSGAIRIPDARVPGHIFDLTIGTKTSATPQVADFFRFSAGSRVTIVRPRQVGGSYSIPR